MSEVAVKTTSSALNAWDAAMAEADVITSPDLAKDEALEYLVGMPMLITQMEFRRGVSRKGKPNDSKKTPYDAYVTLTAQLPPAEFVDFKRVNMKRQQSGLNNITGWADVPFDPNSLVIINDGSTGIYRTCVAYLSEKGAITLPAGPTNGGKGETIYDTAPYEWAEIHAGEASPDDDGFLTAKFTVALAARNGIRLSEYNNDTNPDGSVTRYLS